MVKSFASNIINDLSYNLNKYIQCKHVWKLFEVGCLHQHTVIALCRLNRNEKLIKILRILTATIYFKDRHWICKTVYCICCSVICKIIFCSEFPDIPDKTCRKTRRRRTRQLQSIIRFTERQLGKIKEISRLHRIISYNHVHNIMRIFDILPNFPFITSETKPDY